MRKLVDRMLRTIRPETTSRMQDTATSATTSQRLKRPMRTLVAPRVSSRSTRLASVRDTRQPGTTLETSADATAMIVTNVNTTGSSLASIQYGGTVSPDGRWLAYVSQEGGLDDVYVRPASGQGGKWQISVDGGIVPVWAPDGKEIYYVHDVSMMAVSVEGSETKITAGAPRKLFDFPPGRRSERDLRSFDITPDGKRFVLLRSANPGVGRRQINVILHWTSELEAKLPAKQP